MIIHLDIETLNQLIYIVFILYNLLLQNIVIFHSIISFIDS